MALSASTRLGPYEILSPLGAGGMGEVYRAKDTRLDRTVAIKVLPSHLSSDPERRQRFEREARAVSSLNHPHICTLHDIGHQDGVDFLVMEYLEGGTLAERLAKGPLPVDQVLRYAVEIADALDRAHRQGIIHRDLKPGNIMLTKSGAKLLDFGLAKLRPPDASSPALSGLPTEKELFTGEGTILGTLQYMAPEQLEGREADARTDIFAFGTVVFEMLTGQKAFQAESQASLIAAILQSDPPSISALEPMTPPALDRSIRKCLAKDPEGRWQSAQDLASEIRWITDGGLTAPAAIAGKRRAAGGRFVWGLASLAILAALGLAFVHFGEKPIRAEVIRFSIIPAERSGGDNPEHSSMAISPDGRRLVFVASNESGTNVLWVRALDSFSAQALPGTEDADSPFWSPESRFIGFFSKGKLKKIDRCFRWTSTNNLRRARRQQCDLGSRRNDLGRLCHGRRQRSPSRLCHGRYAAEATKLDASRHDLAHFWQKDIQEELTKPDVIGMGSYNSDSHNIQRVATPDGAVENEGDMQVPVTPYQIPYRMLLPKREQAQNLLVPVCFSASHVAYSTLRMEPQYMIIGQAAGVAAKMAFDAGTAVQDIDMARLTAKLRAAGAVMEWKKPQ